MSLSSADYSHLPQLVDRLMDEFKDRKSASASRLSVLTVFQLDIANKIQQVRKKRHYPGSGGRDTAPPRCDQQGSNGRGSDGSLRKCF